ncbi:MAG: hypothetical protein WCW31_02950 [Patescibacteria group bacterium]|jgi:hypothetical protein
MATKHRRLSELTDEEVRIEVEALREAYDEADRDDAPLLALCWAEEDDDLNSPVPINSPGGDS